MTVSLLEGNIVFVVFIFFFDKYFHHRFIL